MAVGESAGGGPSSESGPRAHMRWHVENNAREENDAWRCVVDWLMLEFLSAGRSGLDASDGGVIGRSWSSCRKSLLEKFSSR